jgi:hypothetical protein
METIKYRKIVVLGRFMISGGFVLTSLLLILASIYLEAPLYRKILSVGAAIAGFAYFGRLFILMHVLLFKNPTMVSFDSENLFVKERVISRKDIQKIDKVGNAPIGFLGIKTPAYVVHCFNGEKINIPTYYVLTNKDEMKISKTFKNYSSKRPKGNRKTQ